MSQKGTTKGWLYSPQSPWPISVFLLALMQFLKRLLQQLHPSSGKFGHRSFSFKYWVISLLQSLCYIKENLILQHSTINWILHYIGIFRTRYFIMNQENHSTLELTWPVSNTLKKKNSLSCTACYQHLTEIFRNSNVEGRIYNFLCNLGILCDYRPNGYFALSSFAPRSQLKEYNKSFVIIPHAKLKLFRCFPLTKRLV